MSKLSEERKTGKWGNAYAAYEAKRVAAHAKYKAAEKAAYETYQAETTAAWEEYQAIRNGGKSVGQST